LITMYLNALAARTDILRHDVAAERRFSEECAQLRDQIRLFLQQLRELGAQIVLVEL